VATNPLPPLLVDPKAWYISTMFIFSYISAISSVIFLVIGMCILKKNTQKKETILHFGLLLISISVWCFANFKADTALTGDSQVLWSNIALVAAYFGSAFHVSFSFALTDGSAWIKTLPYFIISLVTIPLLIFGIGSYHSPVIHYTSPGTVELGSLALVYLLFFIVTAIHTIIILLQKYKHLTVIEQNQRLWVLSGLMIMKLGAALFSIILPLFGIIHLYSATPLASYVALFALAIAVTKHRFLDIRLVMQRGAIYVVLFALFITVSIAATSFVTHTFTGSSFWLNQINILALVLLGLWALPKADSYLRKLTNPWFFKQNYNYLNATKLLQKTTQNHVTVQKIAQNTLNELQTIIPTEAAAVVCSQQQKYFTQDTVENLTPQFQKDFSHRTKHALCLTSDMSPSMASCCKKAGLITYSPIVFNETVVGCLLLGEKKTGEPFTKVDEQLIEYLNRLLAVAIAKAELYDEQSKRADLLEFEVLERTKQIQDLQESQEKNMLDISHALQTPLTVLSLESETLPIEVQNNITSTISRVSESIKELLTLTKLENNHEISEAQEPINISIMCQVLEEYFQTIAQKENIQTTFVIEEDCVILGNYDQLEKVIVNLVENAVKYMPEQNDSHIHLFLQKKDRQLVLEVSDNGIGIAQEERDQIFSRFYRSKKTQDIPGTGLGLAICKEIINKHKGTIEVISRKGTTVFQIILPPHKE